MLRRTFEQGAYADEALQSQARGLSARDRALAMRLAFGTVQRRATLDHVLAELAERPVARLDAHVLAALRLGLYELLYLDGAPERAVVADAVELAKGSGRGGHGLVNAVLRRAVRDGGARLVSDLPERTPAEAALKHSHPEWVAQMWWGELGADGARALMAADNEPGELALRANALVGDAAAIAAQLPVPTRRDAAIPEALVAERAFDVHASQAWRAGAVLAQSRAAMLVALALAPAPGERVLDLCAAPGGKTTHLAALMEGRGEIVAVERDRRRAGALARTAERMGASAVRVVVADATELSLDTSFDRVLVDPPCTGLGTLQAHPDLRWRVNESDPARMAAVQTRILAAGAEVLRPGGVLVYSTCTISPTENERLIASFVASNPSFAIDDLAGETGAFGAAGAEQPGARCVLTLPHRDRTAGFFIARLRRS